MTFSSPLMRRLAVLMICLLGIAWGLRVNAQVSCPDTYIPSRLLMGSEGRVVLEGGANNVRDAAASSGNLLGKLPPGSTFTVVEGPVCGEGHTWVRVDNHAGLIGWTVEIINGRYGLEPNVTAIPPTVFGPGPVDFAGVHFELNPELATQVEASLVLSDQFKALTLPPYIKLVFTPTYPGEYPFMTLRIMSAQSFNNLYPTTISRLSAFLAAPDARGVPNEMAGFVSDWSSITQHIQVIPFGSGQAYRGFSTTWQDMTNPSNYLTYAAHGLSSDGLYYIQADFITYYNDLSLYTPPDGSRDDMNAYLENFHATINNTIDMAPDEAFQPRPSEVDALLASLTIAPGTLNEVIAQANVVAPLVAPTQDALFAKQTQQANAAATSFMEQTATQAAISPAQTATQAAIAPAQTATADARCGILDTRLQVGQYARQTLSGNSSLRVRDAAGGAVIPETFLYPGDVVMVLEGPVCVDEVNWWRVSSAEGGWTGWIAENKDENYYMAFIPPTWTPAPTLPPPPPSSTPHYTCTYTGFAGSRAYLQPGGGEWQYFLSSSTIYNVIGKYTTYDKNGTGTVWYLFAEDSPLSGFQDGTGMTHYRSFWWPDAEGDCSSIPEAYRVIEPSSD